MIIHALRTIPSQWLNDQRKIGYIIINVSKKAISLIVFQIRINQIHACHVQIEIRVRFAATNKSPNVIPASMLWPFHSGLFFFPG